MKEDKKARMFMVTAPRDQITFHQIKRILKAHNSIQWVIGKETGRTGYKHWQIRFKTEESKSVQMMINSWNKWKAHIEDCSESWEYEKKEDYWSSEETGIAKLRYGKLNSNQKKWKKMLEDQDDRQILVIYDYKGKSGKTWFMKHLYSKHKTCIIPPTISTAQGLLQWAYGTKADYYIIDLPRSSTKANAKPLWESIETIKDGILYDSRYYAKMRIQNNPKVMVMTNTPIPKCLLSEDRWQVVTI